MRNRNTALAVLTGLSFYAFFLFGFADNVKGPIIPELLADLNLSYAAGSTLLLSAYIGFMVGVLATGLIASRRDNRTALIIAALGVSLGAAGNVVLGSPLLLTFSFFSLGFGLGAIEVGANGLIATLYPAESGRYLNLLAVFHGAGSMLAPFIAGLFIAGGASWRTVYSLIVPLAALQALLFLLFRRPDGSRRERAADSRLELKLLWRRNLLFYALFLTFYVAAEIGVASWMVDYLLKAKGYPVALGSALLSGYFGCVMLGRFIGSFLVERLGYRRVLIWTSVLSLFCLGAGILAPREFAFLIPLTGLFFSVMFPTATADAARKTDAPQEAVFSVLFFCAGLGGMLGPWLVGFSAQFFSIAGGFAVNLIFIVLMFMVLLPVRSDSSYP